MYVVRVALVVPVAPWLFQRDGQRRSSSARVYKFSLLRSGFESISGTNYGKKVRWTCRPQSTLWRRPWTRVVRVAPVVTCVSRMLSDKRYTAFHDFFCQNARRVVSWRDATSGILALVCFVLGLFRGDTRLVRHLPTAVRRHCHHHQLSFCEYERHIVSC